MPIRAMVSAKDLPTSIAFKGQDIGLARILSPRPLPDRDQIGTLHLGASADNGGKEGQLRQSNNIRVSFQVECGSQRCMMDAVSLVPRSR